MFRRNKKIDYKYFDEDYWRTNGKKSGYSPQQGYVSDGFQWEAIAQMLVKVFGDNKKFLEAGCAFGWIVAELAKAGVNASGFDISRYAIEHSPPEANVIASDGMVRIFPDAEFDVLYTFETAEHICPDDVVLWWSNRVCELTADAQVFATVCTGHENRRGTDDPDLSHQTLQPREWWYSTFENVGLVRCEELEERLNTVEVQTDRLEEPLNLVEYYDWKVFGLVKV